MEQKPRPAQVVVDPERVAETPMGMTPWSAKGAGHEVEDEAAGFQGEIAAKLKLEARSARERYEMFQREARGLAKDMRNELDREPKIDYERMKWVMGVYAGKVNELGGARWGEL